MGGATTVGETAADFLGTNLHLSTGDVTAIMSALLIAVLVFQFRSQKYVPAIYWLAILFTFALGTSAGDLVADQISVGYFWSLILFAAVIVAVFVAYRYFRLNAVLAF